ncbi:hypothetical protein R4Z09_17830 [Niallia oryzisoli]|uniref:Uncharacterized protein n=1 Tax=Niallia oryzisoli TaxID=1737571 RepID=A0ABZ2CA86_9BACI
MKNDTDQTSAGLNQIMEIINAKGDEGELRQIVERANPHPDQKNDQK